MRSAGCWRWPRGGYSATDKRAPPRVRRTGVIYTHHQRRSNPNQYGVNVACLSGLSPFDFEDVVVYDGANHLEDTYSRKPRVAGHLKFISMREAAMAGGTKVD